MTPNEFAKDLLQSGKVSVVVGDTEDISKVNYKN